MAASAKRGLPDFRNSSVKVSAPSACTASASLMLSAPKRASAAPALAVERMPNSFASIPMCFRWCGVNRLSSAMIVRFSAASSFRRSSLVRVCVSSGGSPFEAVPLVPRVLFGTCPALMRREGGGEFGFATARQRAAGRREVAGAIGTTARRSRSSVASTMKAP
jgi:hypothetical protein